MKRTAPETGNLYQEAMKVFHQAADLVGLDRRVRLELEEPDYEHIFYVTANLNDRLVPLGPDEAGRYEKLPVSHLNPAGVVPLYDGKKIGEASGRDRRVDGEGARRDD